MSFKWQNDNLYFDLSYWIIQDYGFAAEDLVGKISFDIKCKKLINGIPQKSVKEIEKIIMLKCDPMIDSLQIIHNIGYFKLINIIANVVWEQRIDVETIESDAERKNRIINNKRKNKK